MTYKLRIKQMTDGFTCRQTGFSLNAFRPEAETQHLSRDMKTVVRSGRVLDMNGAVHAVLEAEKAEKEGKSPKAEAPKEAPKQEEAPKEEPKQEEAPKEEPKVEAPKEEPKAEEPKEEPKEEASVDLAELDKDGLLAFMKEQGLDAKEVGITNRMGEGRIREALEAHLGQEDA